MKITFSDGSVASLFITYEYSARDTRVFNFYRDHIVNVTDTIKYLTELHRAQKDDRIEELISYHRRIDIDHFKGFLAEIRNRPTKTNVTIEYKGQTCHAFSSISKEDAKKSLHSKKLGRTAAFRNLLSECAHNKELFPEHIRKELAQKLLPFVCKDKAVRHEEEMIENSPAVRAAYEEKIAYDLHHMFANDSWFRYVGIGAAEGKTVFYVYCRSTPPADIITEYKGYKLCHTVIANPVVL